MPSKKNKKIRKRLEKIYGEGCFFDMANIAERIESIGGIKTFKVFVVERKYTGQPISTQITLHHLQHISEGGATTVDNGANVKEIAHQYIHSLPRDQEEIVNDMIRDFKLNCVMVTGDGKVQEAQSISFNFKEDVLTIPLVDNDEYHNPEIAKRQRLERERQLKLKEDKLKEKGNRLKHKTRAVEKRELQQMIKEEEEWEI